MNDIMVDYSVFSTALSFNLITLKYNRIRNHQVKLL